MHPCFITFDAGQMRHWWGPPQTTLFSSNCTTWLIDVHPNWLEENIFKVLHIVPLDLQFCHMQRHVRWHVNILHSYMHQHPLRTMDVCTTHDGWDGRESVRGPNKNALINVSTAVFNEIWVMNAHSKRVFFTEDLVALFQVFPLSCYQALLPGLCF